MTVSARRDQIQRHISGPNAPSAVEAEKVLIGIVLGDPGAFALIDGLGPAHFYEPLHGRLWQAISDRQAGSGFVSPELLDGAFLTDDAYRSAGGLPWLQSLADLAPGASRIQAYVDEVREAAQRRQLLVLADDLARDIRDGETTATEAIGRTEATLLAMQTGSKRLEPVTAAFAAGRVLEWLDAPPEDVMGIRTGLDALDEQLGPLLPGNVIGMAGRTSMGKSAAAQIIGYNIALQGYGVIELNSEMNHDEMALRHLADICQRRWGSKGPKYSDIRARKVTPDHRAMLAQAAEDLKRVPLVMLKRSGMRMSQLRSLCRRQAATWARQGIKLGAVVGDHMGHFLPDRSTKDRYGDQTLVSNGTKEIADELECAFVALLQVNRDPEKRDDPRPRLSDLRDSGAWEQDCDAVIGWFREQYYAQRAPEPKGGLPGSKEDAAWAEWDRARRSPVVEALILKARHGPPTTVKLWGDVSRNAIRDRAPDDHLL